MSVAEALAADRRGDLVHAADLYEQIAAEPTCSLEVLLNLACLYWQATDPGNPAGRDRGFFERAAMRTPEILTRARNEPPTSGDAWFWHRYVAWADLGEPLTVEDCRELRTRDPSSLMPALYLFTQSNGREAAAEALVLLEQARRDSTSRARYVRSVIEATLATYS